MVPRGGFYLRWRLPDGMDAIALARVALREDVVLDPGNVFSLSVTIGGLLRFNVAQLPDARTLERAWRLASS